MPLILVLFSGRSNAPETTISNLSQPPAAVNLTCPASCQLPTLRIARISCIL
jgi:hypothetical protein